MIFYPSVQSPFMVIHLRPILSQNALLWNLWLKHSTVYLSTHLLACSPVHSATLITIYISYLFTASPLLYLVLSPFSLNSKISWPNLLDSLAPKNSLLWIVSAGPSHCSEILLLFCRQLTLQNFLHKTYRSTLILAFFLSIQWNMSSSFT